MPLAEPSGQVEIRTLRADYGLIHVLADDYAAAPPKEGKGPFDEASLPGTESVFVGDRFLILRVRSSRPVLTLQAWPKRPSASPHDTPAGSLERKATGVLSDTIGRASATTATGGYWGTGELTLPLSAVAFDAWVTDQSQVAQRQRELILASNPEEETPTDLEFWVVRFWPAN